MTIRILSLAGLLGLAFVFGCRESPTPVGGPSAPAQSFSGPQTGSQQPGAVVEDESAVVETITGRTMGTTYTIRAVVAEADHGRLEATQAKVDSVLAEVNRQMSTYDPESELSRFNQAPADQWFAVSPALVEVVRLAGRISEESEGAFDVTVGPAVNIWRFGPDKKRTGPPSDEEVNQSLKLIGYQQVQFRAEPPGLKKTTQAIYVDLSAIAKGYGVDQVCELLSAEGYASFMVEIGGEVRTAGMKPGAQPWQIGVETASDRRRVLEAVVGLEDQAMATSGDYRNFFIHEGQRYSHTINPRTARPVWHDLASVTVVHETCAEADGYATALLVLGPEEGYNFAEAKQLAAHFQQRHADGSITVKTTSAWRDQIRIEE